MDCQAPMMKSPAVSGRDRNGLPLELRDLIAAQKPGWGLDRPFYTDPAIFALDMERIFLTNWLFVGHTSRIPNPGDYFTYQVGQEPLLIIRGHDGEIHALLNVCRHRGSKLCLDDGGNVKKLVCPYHQWVYDTDGRLVNARFMADDFDREAFSLHRARVHRFEGFLFVCLAEAPPPFAEPKREWLAPYAFETARLAHRAAYTVLANWKIVVENFFECYHCGGVHPEYSHAMAGATTSYLSPEAVVAESGRTREEVRETLARLGLDADRPRMQFRNGVCTQSLDGQPVAPLMGTHRDYDGTMMAVWVHPTLEMEANPDHVVAFRFTPLGPTCTDVEVSWLVRGDAVEGVDYDRERLISFWKITGEQDWKICEVVQAGVNSRYYAPGPLARAEGGPRGFLRKYLAQLSGEE